MLVFLRLRRSLEQVTAEHFFHLPSRVRIPIRELTGSVSVSHRHADTHIHDDLWLGSPIDPPILTHKSQS